MKPMTPSEKFNIMRPSVFFREWEIFGPEMRATLVLLYILFSLVGLTLICGAGCIVWLMIDGKSWDVLAVSAVICLLLTPSSTKPPRK